MGTSSQECYDILRPLNNELVDLYFRGQPVVANITLENVTSLLGYCSQMDALELENVFSEPMVSIGIYIALASLCCIVAMGADLLHGFRNRKFWFPCKYFTLNAASITMIAVATKLPVDLTSLFATSLDQATKLGSMAFMCTMMANFIPSLASMDNGTLIANVTGLAILVITIIVNISIQINTGAINGRAVLSGHGYNFTNYMVHSYTLLLAWLLVLLISSAITIPAYKEVLEIKYQAATKRTLDGQDSLESTVEKLNQYLRRYWVMAESGSPQFVMASNPLSITSGIICVFSLIVHIVLMIFTIQAIVFPRENKSLYGLYSLYRGKESDYKWSMYFIAITQSIGVVVGSIAPIFRCFTIMNFKLFSKQNTNQFKVFKVEKYWIQKLGERTERHVRYLSSCSRSSTLVLNLIKNQFIGIGVGFQKITAVSSKMMGLIPLVLLICVECFSYWWKSLMSRLFVPPDTPRIDKINIEDLRDYVLQLEDDIELGERTLKRISNSIDDLIQKAEKKQLKNFLMLLEKYNGFRGVENFDNDQVLPLTSFNLVNSWSLPIVTLTCIAIALPNICKDEVDSLFKSVREGLLYTHIVDESLNNTCEYGNIRKATMTLWHEVEEKSMWLENTLKASAYREKTSIEILRSFADKAEDIVMQSNTTNEEVMENTQKLILANSMYRITRTMLLNYQGQPTSEELFALISSMIADILCACFTNIPRVIMMKCHESVEKREAGVKAAARLFGSTKEVIKRLEVWELPSMDPVKMAFIDEWHSYMKQSIP